MRRFALVIGLAACTSEVSVLEVSDNAHQVSAMAKDTIPAPGVVVDVLATVGDLDGDGIEDLVIVDRGSTGVGASGTGAVDIIYGARPFPPLRDLRDVPRLVTNDGSQFGRITIVPGDFDGDGLADFAVVHDCGLQSTAGAYIVYGAQHARLVGTQTLGEASAAHLIVPDACAGAAAATDLDGDGKSDLALSAAPMVPVSTPPVGAVYLLYGGARWVGEVQVPAQADAVLTDDPVGIGSIMGAIGDVDGDGHEDLFIVNDGYYNQLDGRETRKAYIVAGGATRLRGPLVASDLGTLVEGFIASPGDRTVARLGDFDGDGVDDFAVASGRAEELASVFYGRRGGFGPHIFTAQADAHLVNHQESADLDAALAGTGGVAGGGRSDFIVGNPQRGAVYILPGGPRYQGTVDVDKQSTVLVAAVEEAGPGPLPDTIGGNIAVGDVDGDGRPDLVVAARSYYGAPMDQIYVLDLAP